MMAHVLCNTCKTWRSTLDHHLISFVMLPETYVLPQIQSGSHVCSNLSVQLCLSHQAGRIHPGKQL